MAAIRDLAPRVLRKLMVLAAGETASAEDYELAVEKLKAVHSYLEIEGLVRWTMQDIPMFAEEPYVSMAAFLSANEFERSPDPGMWEIGLRQIQSGIALKSSGTTYTEYF